MGFREAEGSSWLAGSMAQARMGGRGKNEPEKGVVGQRVHLGVAETEVKPCFQWL